MAVAGVDMGSLFTKVVILDGGKILAAVCLDIGDDFQTEAVQASNEALTQAGLKRADVTHVIATGAGSSQVGPALRERSIAERSIVSCVARGATFFFPQARAVLDAGADSVTAIRLAADGSVEDSAGHTKCASFTGLFLDYLGGMVGIPVGDMGAEARKATAAQAVTSGCAVYAVAEIISLVHRVPPIPGPNILAGIHEAMTNGLFGISQRVGMRSDAVMCGGVARNIDIVRRMEAKLGSPLLIPENPQILGALGAALFAQQDQEREGARC